MPSLNYSEVVQLYCDAEKRLKKVEHLTSDLAIPAINQLRYAGRHLVRILGNCAQDSQKELEQAENHCKRASFDACESGLIYCLENFKALQQDFNKTPIGPHFPDYIKAREIFNDAREFIDITPESTREDFYKAIDGHLDKLIEIDKKLPYIREEINKFLEAERRTTKKIIIGLIIAAIAAIAAIVSIPMLQGVFSKPHSSSPAQIQSPAPVVSPPTSKAPVK